MRKNTQVSAKVKKIVCVACLFGMVSLQAQGQSFGQAAESARFPVPTPPPVANEIYGERGLPSFTSRTARDEQNQNLNSIQNGPRPVRQVAETKELAKRSFSEYVETVTGAPLQFFGRNLFTDVPTTFSPFDSAQVNGDYVIGTGDELQIRGWGMVNVDVTATVDRSGAIYIPRVGTVRVAGIKYRDLQGHLKQAIGRIFSNFELTASISQTRAIQIYVVGHALRPGTYTLNSMSTLLNALFTSGGPDSTGSMRAIQLKRGGETVASFDLYDMLIKGDKSGDATLRDGDVIYIPEVGPLAALTGNVKTPAIFELKGRSSMLDLVSWAGGVDSAAEQKQIIVEKTVDNTYRTLVELVAEPATMNSRLAGIPVQPTDVVRVFAPGAVPVQAQLQHEYVRVSGEVKKSGMFQLRKGESLRELISRLGGVTDNGYVYATQLKRESVKRTQQLRLDEVTARFERESERSATQRLAMTSDKDAVAIQQTELAWQRNRAHQMRTVKAEGRIVLELENGDAKVENLPDLPLQDGDSIHIPRKPGTVEVLGAVFQQNSFIYMPGRTVRDYINLAGGEVATADGSEMYLIRADGTARSGRTTGWVRGLGGVPINAGDTIVVPEATGRTSWTQAFKEWTTILYQFGLGAAGLKVLQN
jgi:protein involved in polysaccharide export with SLBB domain